MKEIKVLSFGKINLSLNVLDTLSSGMHQVDMIMQQISFHDDVNIRFTKNTDLEAMKISIATNKYYLPVDERNLSYKAAALMAERFKKRIPKGLIEIEIFKRIPVAAGLAGGSGNGAAVLHGLNALWNLGLSLDNICELGAELGSDVPFCVIGQAKENFVLPRKIRKDPKACSCMRAIGTGTELIGLGGIKKAVVIAKPPIGVSTAEAYRGIDNCKILKRPDNDSLIKGINENNYKIIYENCINVLEEYTLKAYPRVLNLKDLMSKDKKAEKVLMSGSGPTVFALYANVKHAKAASDLLRDAGYESYWTKTTK